MCFRFGLVRICHCVLNIPLYVFQVPLGSGMSHCSKHTLVCVSGTARLGYDGRERVLALESGAAESGQGVHVVACAHGTGQQQEEMITMATNSNKRKYDVFTSHAGSNVIGSKNKYPPISAG